MTTKSKEAEDLTEEVGSSELGEEPTIIGMPSEILEQDAQALEQVFNPELDTREGEEPSLWEERFEAQINTFFDEAIARVPGFVDRHLRSFRRVMTRSVAPRTGVGDIAIGVRNLLAGVSRTVGGPDFSTTTFTHDVLTDAFEREVVSPAELESLLGRLFSEFEDDQWQRLARSQAGDEGSEQSDAEAADELRGKLMRQTLATSRTIHVSKP